MPSTIIKIIFSLFCSALLLVGHAQSWEQTNRQAMSYYQNGDLDRALETIDRAIALSAPQSSERLISWTNKGYFLSDKSDLTNSIRYFRQASNLANSLYSLPHVAQTDAYTNLVNAFLQSGRLDSAEFYLQKALPNHNAIETKNPAHYDSSYAEITRALILMNAAEASLYYRKGLLGQAIQSLQSQIALIRQVYLNYESSTDYQKSLNNLVTYELAAGQPAEAKVYAQEYWELVQEKENALDQVYALLNLGSVYRELDNYDSAFYYWDLAQRISTSNGLEQRPVHSSLLNNLGEMLFELEIYNQAINYFEQSLAIQSSKPLKDPITYQTTLYNLAECYRWNGNYPEADEAYQTLIANLVEDIQQNFTYLSESEKLIFYQKQQGFIQSYLSFALEISGLLPLQDSDNPYINDQIAGSLYNLQLTTKAIILNSSKRMKERILSSGNAELIANYENWDRLKNLYSSMQTSEQTEENIQAIKERIENTEKWLVAHSQNFKTGFEMEQVDWQTIQNSLEGDEAAIEMIRLLDGLAYLALIVTPETSKQPKMALVLSRKSKHLEKELYQGYHNSMLYQLEDSLSYTVYWQPIDDALKSLNPKQQLPKRIYISNDGIYNQINLQSLQDPKNGKYLIEETEVVPLTNTKELLTQKAETTTKEAMLIGNPKFSNSSARQPFSDLPGTAEEIKQLTNELQKAKWKTVSYIGKQATKDQLLNSDNPRILHIATHGFFTPTNSTQWSSLTEAMLGSGIALAGANDTNQGLISAYEVTNMSLDQTELVVLSACETGLGTNNAGEGVYGLQRALHVAGAQHLIMSLWKVDDQATQELMTLFYANYLKSNAIHQAFREAQLQLKEKYAHPYYWGAFVLTGK